MIPTWRLTVRSDFSSAHALRNYNGKCEALHGHNFAVEVVVEGTTLTQDTELLVDFKVLKNHLKDILDGLDHKDLSALPYFQKKNPSSENISAFIYSQMKERLTGLPVRIYSASVSEKAAQTATYLEL